MARKGWSIVSILGSLLLLLGSVHLGVSSYYSYCSGNTAITLDCHWEEYPGGIKTYVCTETSRVDCSLLSGWRGHTYFKWGCSGGECVVRYTYSCYDWCNLGQKMYVCIGANVYKRTCGNYDSDPCLEWGPLQYVKNCNMYDGWYLYGIRGRYQNKAGAEYRDYYCSPTSVSGCTYRVVCRNQCNYGEVQRKCSGDTVVERRCIRSGTCTVWTSWKTVKNCNSYDKWYATGKGYSYRDYYCTNGQCQYRIIDTCISECLRPGFECVYKNNAYYVVQYDCVLGSLLGLNDPCFHKKIIREGKQLVVTVKKEKHHSTATEQFIYYCTSDGKVAFRKLFEYYNKSVKVSRNDSLVVARGEKVIISK